MEENTILTSREDIPFFSVVIPTYNRAHSIKKALESLFSQSFGDFEIIVVDDSSTDNTRDVISTIRDPRLYYYRNDTNKERCITRNRGIELSKGKYICFLDSDDYHLPNHLEIIYNEIQRLGAPIGFLFTNAWDENAKGDRSERCCPDFNLFDGYFYFLHYTVNPQRWAIHRSVFEVVKFDSEIVICEDMDTSLRILAAGFPVFQIRERSTVYVAATDSFTMSDKMKSEKELFYLKKIFARAELKNLLPRSECNRLISMCHFHLAVKAYDNSRFFSVYYHTIFSFFKCFKGYNGKTNKILIVICLYSLPLVGRLLKFFSRIIKK